MSAEQFTSRPGSARGLLARPILASGAIAYLADIDAITYTVTNITDGGTSAPSSLTVANVMFATLQTQGWTADNTGYTFRWEAPGTLWPDPSKQYFIDVSFTGSDGLTYKRAWEVTTDDR